MTAAQMCQLRPGPPPTLWLHVGGFWAIAVVQPLLDLVAANPEFFVAHRAGRFDILLLVISLSFGLPSLLAAAAWAAGRAGPRIGIAVLYAVLGSLAGLVAMQLAVRAGASSWPVAVAIAAVAAAGLVTAYHAWAPVRSFFSVLSLAVLIVPVLFLSMPGIRSMVWGGTTAAAFSAPSADHGGSVTTPVVLVIFDELPLVSLLDANRRIDSALYPHFASLASDGVWFRNATTVDDYTKYALPAMLSGRYPSRVALPSAIDYADTLFTLLAPTHRLEVSEAVTALCPPTLCAAPDPPSLRARIAAMSGDLRVVFLHLVLTSDLTQSLPDPTTTWAGFAGGDARVPTDPTLRLATGTATTRGLRRALFDAIGSRGSRRRALPQSSSSSTGLVSRTCNRRSISCTRWSHISRITCCRSAKRTERGTFFRANAAGTVATSGPSRSTTSAICCRSASSIGWWAG